MINALIPYILLALSLIANLIGFLVLVHETQAKDARNRKRFDERIEELERRLLAVQSSSAEPPLTVRSGLNVSKRAQAMRMFRRNEDVSHIAAALGVARKEVELLVRVQKMTMNSSLRQIFQNPFADQSFNNQLCTQRVQ
jgi:hypothetical protein